MLKPPSPGPGACCTTCQRPSGPASRPTAASQPAAASWKWNEDGLAAHMSMTLLKTERRAPTTKRRKRLNFPGPFESEPRMQCRWAKGSSAPASFVATAPSMAKGRCRPRLRRPWLRRGWRRAPARPAESRARCNGPQLSSCPTGASLAVGGRAHQAGRPSWRRSREDGAGPTPVRRATSV